MTKLSCDWSGFESLVRRRRLYAKCVVRAKCMRQLHVRKFNKLHPKLLVLSVGRGAECKEQRDLVPCRSRNNPSSHIVEQIIFSRILSRRRRLALSTATTTRNIGHTNPRFQLTEFRGGHREIFLPWLCNFCFREAHESCDLVYGRVRSSFMMGSIAPLLEWRLGRPMLCGLAEIRETGHDTTGFFCMIYGNCTPVQSNTVMFLLPIPISFPLAVTSSPREPRPQIH
jgi:hypothetical protein